MKLFVIGVDETTLTFLAAKGFSITSGDGNVSEPEDLKDWIEFGAYEAVVIDLDKVNFGSLAARYLRSKEILISVIGISKGNGENPWSEQRATFLENGGDDLIKSPASPRELAASLRASTRRGKGLIMDVRELRHGNALVRFNLSTQVVTVNGIQVHLTGKEMILLSLLVSSGNRVQSKEMLLSGLYSDIEDEAAIKIVDVFICKLRNKFREIDSDAGEVIETVWGRGYKIGTHSQHSAAA